MLSRLPLEQIIAELKNIGCYKTGDFTLKSGRKSNYYIDLRTVIQYPRLLVSISSCIAQRIKVMRTVEELQHVGICGLPYGAIPLATLIAAELNTGLVLIRKERKEYGTKKLIEGLNPNIKEVILIDDIITSGTTILETVEAFKAEAPNIIIKKAIVVVDREEKRINTLPDIVSNVMSLFRLEDFIDDANVFDKKAITLSSSRRMSFTKRANNANEVNSVCSRLFRIIDEKKTNLIVSIDESDPTKILQLTYTIAPYVCAIKFHSDIWDNSTPWNQLASFRKLMYERSKTDNFMIFEDRKFADIGAIVQKQYQQIQNNYYNSNTIDIVTVLPCAGRGTIDAIKKQDANVGVLLVSQLSSANNLIDTQFTKRCVELAYNEPNLVTGFIVQQRTEDMTDDNYVYCTPGVNEGVISDNQDQRYRTIEDAIIRDKCDVIIVGRGITNDSNPGERAKLYSQKAYECYESLCA